MSQKRIHSTAILSGDITLGDNVTVGPYAIIDGRVSIGDNTEIDAHVRITGSVTIGSGNRIFHAAYIGGPPQDMSFNGSESFVEIGDNNTLREFVQIHRGTKPGTVTRLGNNNFLMGGVHCAHNVQLGSNITIANNAMLAGYVRIDDYTFVSGLTGFHQFVRVGKYAMIGGCTKINKDCPPFMMFDGNPASVIGLNVVGLRRREFSAERRQTIKNAYRILYRSNRNTTQALAVLKNEFPNNDDIKELIAFIESSERGIYK